MSYHARHSIRTSVAAGVIAFLLSAFACAEDTPSKVDADAAKNLARTDHCLRCHAVNKKKEGPSYHEIAAKYKGQPDAQKELIEHITSGTESVKLSDGHKELHKFDKTTDKAQIENLVRWILAQ
jgi:cytochrome c